MSSGKKVRMAKLFQKTSRKSVIVPMDHGATLGPIHGLVDIGETLSSMSLDVDLVQGLVLHRGVVDLVNKNMATQTLPARILHVSASTSVSGSPSAKMLVAGVEDALRLGADAVSVHVNLGVETDGLMLQDFGTIASQCQHWGMPLLAMMYVRAGGAVSIDVKEVKHAARLAAEMGADLVKVSYPGSAEAMQEVVDGCFIPVLIAGGEKCASPPAALDMVREAIRGGAAGVCMGRNLFQHEAPHAFAMAVGHVVHGHAGHGRLGQHNKSGLAIAFETEAHA
jgi:predicted phospho-2-dehydro-3-deoxyheptonate aldolase